VNARRRRAAVLLALAVACGGLAASQVAGQTRAIEARVGRAVPVVVAARDLEAGRELSPGDFAVRDVPRRFAPPDAVDDTAALVGATTTGAIARGSYVTAGQLGDGDGSGGRPGALRRGERAVELGVAGGAALTAGAGPGTRVDVLVTTDPRDGNGRTFVALEDVEVLDLAEGGGESDGEDGARATATARATLRVTARQAVYLTAAESFAREVRLLPRPAGDRRAVGRGAVSAGGL
jgi:pilus assembly protein CpaB